METWTQGDTHMGYIRGRTREGHTQWDIHKSRHTHKETYTQGGAHTRRHTHKETDTK